MMDSTSSPLKILLRNTQPLLGDRLMFTPAVRDLKTSYPDYRIGIISAGPEIWHNNPYIDNSINEHNADKVFDIGPAAVTKGSKTNGLHIAQAFRISLEGHLGKPIKQGPLKPDIHLSQAEKNNRIIDGRYWVINIDCGPFSAKRWPAERFQQLVNEMPEITFVQIGLSNDNQYRLKGDNVIDLIDKTKIRELFSLVYNADGCISLVSSLMHVAAAFDKPCVVLAGGREPMTFEHYPFHRYLHTIGCVPCAKEQACWKNSIGACKDSDGKTAKCMEIIPVSIVKEALLSYYKGGILDALPEKVRAREKPLLRIVSNCRFLGGAERSVCEIARQFVLKNWRVELAPAGEICEDIEQALPAEVKINNHLTRPCDCLLLYASDMVFNFDSPKFEVFNRLQARRKVMALTYKIGKAGEQEWTKGWDRYLFLSSTLCNQFRDRDRCRDGHRDNNNIPNPIPDTIILAPAVNIEPFLKVEPVYGNNGHGPIRMVRHSSQGEKKFPEDLKELIDKTTAGRVFFYFKPLPIFLYQNSRIKKFFYQDDPEDVAKFLGMGNCYWYLLPEGYTDQGPRTIVEAMAAGLPVIAENRDGAKDRVTSKTGWLINDHKEAIEIINNLTPGEMEEKGRSARARAQAEFRAEKWFEAITNI